MPDAAEGRDEQQAASPAAAQAPPFFRNLEALRGICALIVVLYHIEYESPITLNFVVRHGWIFVDFFFVLSGFVIVLVHMRAATGAAAARRFLIRRFFRLYPLHLAMMAAVGAMIAVRYAMDPAKAPSLGINADFGLLVIANLLLVHAWGFFEALILNVPSWSVSTEWAAYLVTAALFACVGRLRWRIAGLALVGLACLLILLNAGGAALNGPTVYRLPRCLFGFSVGALVYVASRRFPIRSLRGAVIAQAVAIIGIVLILARLDDNPGLGLVFPPMAGLLLLGAIADRSSLLFSGLVSHPAQLLGRLSYSIYMIHTPILMLANFGVERLVGVKANGHAILSAPLAALATIFVVAVVLLLSTLTYRWIEHPWRERGRRISARLSAPTGAGPALR